MSKTNGYRTRFDFSKIPATIQIPNLIEVQRRSYERFLQMDRLPSERDDAGLQAVFQSVFPISDFRNVSQLEFVDYAIGNWECKCGHLKGLHHLRTTCKNCGSTVITDPFHPGEVLCNKCGTYNANTPDFCNKCGDPVGLQLKYDVAECEERGMTYSAPLKVTMRLTIFDKDAETGNRSIRDIKEQEVFFGDVPLMTQNGTFIINGTERVIVSQLHRSPGVFFETANNRTYFLGKIIPYRGWNSNTTRRTCSMYALTASASFWEPSSCALSACVPERTFCGRSTPSIGWRSRTRSFIGRLIRAAKSQLTCWA
jgi:DNA-directed RNA polymerase subunit beta